MKRYQRSLAALVVAGAATAVGFFGFNAVQDARFAFAQEKVEATRQQLAQVEDLATVFRHVGKTVEPSVVSIAVRKTVTSPFHRAPFDEDMLRRFFPDRDNDGQPDLPPGLDGGDEPMVQMGTGSGVIMEVENGTAYIVTNNHVVTGATELEITLSDGRKAKDAKVLGTDPKTDLAVVQISAERLIPAKWGNSDELQKGDWVLAFGSPFGYVGSMTHGIVSALNRHDVRILGTMGYEDFIQVDAPINPGNSGGPLVNIRGEVIGINTAILSRSGGFQGVGFAIPSGMARGVYTSLKQHGKVTRGWLGVGIQDVTVDLEAARRLGYTGEQGVLVREIFPNTPAAGKLRPGDVIVGLDGKPVEQVQELRTQVASITPGKEAKLQIVRDGKKQDVTLTIGQQPDDVRAMARADGRKEPTTETAPQDAGLTLADPSDELVKRFSLPADRKGAVVTEVTPRSPAAMAGLRAGDLITRIGDTPVESAEQANNALASADLKKGVNVWATSREGERLMILRSERP